jgi:hypothetical protein
VDLDQKTITIGKVKSVAGTGRVIPMNDELLAVMSSHAKRFTDILGEIRPTSASFTDPTRPPVEIKTA